MDRPRRSYSRARSRGGLRDVDAAARGRFLHALGWLSLAGLSMGSVVGLRVFGGLRGAVGGAVAGLLVVGAGGAALLVWATGRIGGLARVLYNPSGSSTPYRTDLSRARSLAMRGEYAQALEEYRRHMADDPRDPAAYLAAARLLGGRLGRHEEEARVLREARTRADLGPEQEILVARRLIETYRLKLNAPRRAAPELARLARNHPDTPEGRWAESELAELKESMIRESDG